MAIKSNVTDLRSRRDKFSRQIKLISGGYAAPTAFPDGLITVYPWDSTVNEWYLEQAKRASPAEQDVIQYRLIERLCHLNGCDVKNFVVGDVFSVLLVAKSILTQNTVGYRTVCPKCGYSTEDTINVPDDLGVIAQKTASYPGFDVITLPESRDVVKLRPLLIGDEISVANRPDSFRAGISTNQARLMVCIVSINDTTPDTFTELHVWLEALSPKDYTCLETQQDAITPQLDMNVPHICDKCGHSFKQALVMDAEFFRSGRLN